MGFPSLPFVLLQGLLVAVLILSAPVAYAFGGRLKMSTGDLMLLAPVYPAFAIVTIAVFWPFEGDWADAAFGPLGALRAAIVGGLAVALGMLITQRHQLPKLPVPQILHRLGSVFLVGAAWGLVWSLSGWLLIYWGMRNG